MAYGVFPMLMPCFMPGMLKQLIELSFSESEGSTTVRMVNSGISTDARRDAQDEGWHRCLDELERVVTSRGVSANRAPARPG